MPSETPAGSCAVVSDWLKMCREDFIAIGMLDTLRPDNTAHNPQVTVSFFVIYVVWGIRFTVFVCMWCKRKLTGTPQDLEHGGISESDTEAEYSACCLTTVELHGADQFSRGPGPVSLAYSDAQGVPRTTRPFGYRYPSDIILAQVVSRLAKILDGLVWTL